VYDVKVPFI